MTMHKICKFLRSIFEEIRMSGIRVILLCGEGCALLGLCQYELSHLKLVLCWEQGLWNLPQTTLAVGVWDWELPKREEMRELVFLFLSFVISGKCQWLSQCQSRLGTRIGFQKPSCLVLTIWIHGCTICLFIGSFITLLPVFPLKNFRTHCLTMGLPFVSS